MSGFSLLIILNSTLTPRADVAMMTMLAAMERTEEHFAKLLQEAGLKLREVIRYDEEYGDSLIVAVPDTHVNGHTA